MATILLIDDESEIRQSVRNFLEDYDYDILEADCGMCGIEMFRKHRPDMVLLDLRMPGMDGLEVLEALRAGYPDIPVIVISGAGILKDVVTALRLGAWDFLFKPIEDMFVLKHAVEMNLDRARLIKENREYHQRLEQEVERKTSDLMQTNFRLEKEISQRRQTEARYRALVEGIGQPIFQFDRSVRVLFCNQAAASYLGLTPHDMIGRHLHDVVPAEIADPLNEMIQDAFHKGELTSKEMSFVIRERTFWFEFRMQPVLLEDEVPTLIGVALDITERKRSEQETLEARAHLQAAIEQSPAGILLADKKSKSVVMANRAFYETFRVPLDEELFSNYPDMYENGKLLELDDMPLRRAMLHGAVTRGSEIKVRLINGEIIWLNVNASPIRNEEGEIVAGIGMYLDITRSKQMEEDKLQYFAAFDQTAESIAISDMNGLIEYVNPFFCSISGYSRDEIVGKMSLIPSPDAVGKQHHERIWSTLRGGGVWKGQLQSKSRNGEIIIEDVTIAPVYDTTGEIRNYVAVKRDISDQKRFEQQLQQAQKMEALGTLAGGIAHDFNNILSVIFGYIEMAQMSTDAGPQTQDYLREVQSASQRARELVQQILTFSRQKDQAHQPVYVHLIVKEVLNFIRASIPKHIQIESTLDKNLGGVLADPTQLHQVLMNLCTNAYHAMKEKGGVLCVELSRGMPDADASQLVAKSYVRLRVQDTGHGMSDELLTRIFDPYFTTKTKEEGTGLGLSVVHGIVTSMNGFIDVESEPGKGTAFTLYFPELKVNIEPKRQEMTSDMPHGQEHIMIVDDEAQIVILVERFLTKLGYTVESFTSSAKAWERFQEDPDAFDILFTDMHMPHMTGAHLTQLAIDLKPDLPVIMATGYSDIIDDEQAKEMGIRAFLYKPVVYTQLAKVVREVLDDRKAVESEVEQRR